MSLTGFGRAGTRRIAESARGLCAGTATATLRAGVFPQGESRWKLCMSGVGCRAAMMSAVELSARATTHRSRLDAKFAKMLKPGRDW